MGTWVVAGPDEQWLQQCNGDDGALISSHCTTRSRLLCACSVAHGPTTSEPGRCQRIESGGSRGSHPGPPPSNPSSLGAAHPGAYASHPHLGAAWHSLPPRASSCQAAVEQHLLPQRGPEAASLLLQRLDGRREVQIRRQGDSGVAGPVACAGPRRSARRVGVARCTSRTCVATGRRAQARVRCTRTRRPGAGGVLARARTWRQARRLRGCCALCLDTLAAGLVHAVA